MASNNSFSSATPTVVLPPMPPDQYFASSHYTTNPPAGHDMLALGNSFTPNASLPTTPGSLAGRKRSRGDLHAPEEDGDLDDGSTRPLAELVQKSRGEPVLGPGMTLVYPDDPGYEARPESQSGTWVEERAELHNHSAFADADRPPMTTRKSQRVNAASGPDDLAQLVLPPQMREVTTEPLIDEATRALGISWTRMDASEALQISQAAYAKWIRNHYPGLLDVAVWFENSALPGYLVAARNAYSGHNEFYLFAHDLTEARLVTADPAQLIPRLQMLPALHLAAPGGCIKAETDVVPALKNEVPPPPAPVVENARPGTANDDSFMMTHTSMLWALCSAHEMETD